MRLNQRTMMKFACIALSFSPVLLSSCSTPSKTRSAKATALDKSIGMAYFGRYSEAIQLAETVESRDPELSRLAVVAIRVSELAGQLAPWKGSDFGQATPWYKTSEFPFLGEGGPQPVHLATPDKDYFHRIIDHGLKRLTVRAKILEETKR